MSRPTVLAAGGVLWRSDPADPEVAVVHRPRYDDWSLPKGKAKPGEHLLMTALREMSEETGHRPRIGARLTTVRYRVTSGGRPANKVVTYWSMRQDGGSFRAGREVDEMEWLSLSAARRRVTSAADRSVLDVFARTVRDTGPLLLLRNGSTAPTPGRRGRAAESRLTTSGRDQADALVAALGGLGVSDLLSADLPACTEMLAPFAAASGLTVRREGLLTRAGFEGPAWTHLALHEIRDATALDAPERERARGTAWRDKLATRPWFAGSGRWLYRPIHTAVASATG